MNVVASANLRDYWEERAERFATSGSGLAAVCSYGMPEFHNLAIDLTQSRALAPAISRIEPGAAILDVGCGIGRWSRRLAAKGFDVFGTDVSAVMVDEARRRTRRVSLADKCRFETGDLRTLDLGRTFDYVFGVTVLQHILDEADLSRAVGRIARHLRPNGRAILLEAAPTWLSSRCDSSVFRARTAGEYLEMFSRHGLERVGVTGVDPVPLRTAYLPLHRRLPRLLSLPLLFGLTALSLPIDLATGRHLAGLSWHKVFVLERRSNETI